MATPAKQSIERPHRCQLCAARLPFGCGMYVGNYGPLCARCEPGLRVIHEGSQEFNRKQKERAKQRFKFALGLIFGISGAIGILVLVRMFGELLP